jgi:hypothetical protein
MSKIEFDKIFFGLNGFGYISLLFHQNIKNYFLYFDGIDFYIKKNIDGLSATLSELKYDKNGENLFVERITQFEETTFIRISNGDIFQISSMFDDEKISQKLTIFNEKSKGISTPLGINAYEAAAKRAEEANQVEIIKEA